MNSRLQWCALIALAALVGVVVGIGIGAGIGEARALQGGPPGTGHGLPAAVNFTARQQQLVENGDEAAYRLVNPSVPAGHGAAGAPLAAPVPPVEPSRAEATEGLPAAVALAQHGAAPAQTAPVPGISRIQFSQFSDPVVLNPVEAATKKTLQSGAAEQKETAIGEGEAAGAGTSTKKKLQSGAAEQKETSAISTGAAGTASVALGKNRFSHGSVAIRPG